MNANRLEAILPFTDWQNDLHLINGTVHGHFLCLRLDFAKLITAATRAFSGAHSIGSYEDRSGYVCCQVLHQPSSHCDCCHGLPMRFAGRASYAAGADSLIIAGATYYEPGVSGPGWAWTDADHLELNGYAGEAIGAEGDLVLTLAGQNSVTESHAPDADITLCGMEVWGNLSFAAPGPDGDGLAVRDPRLSGARGGRLHRRCPGGRGRYF